MAKHQTDTKKEHSKCYWEEGRNGYYYNTTLDGVTENIEVEINPKMLKKQLKRDRLILSLFCYFHDIYS